MSNRTSRLAVIVCSAGRPDSLADLVPFLVDQSRPADQVIFSVPGPDHIGFDPAERFPAETRTAVVFPEKGLPRQRNAGLDAMEDGIDLVVFFDDDFLPSRHALAGIEAAFAAYPEAGGLTGHVIADGINGAGFSHEEAARKVADWDATHPEPTAGQVMKRGLEGLYGCNMAYRVSAIGQARFDEALPLYGWQEDIDFAAQITGERLKTDAFAGVHRGAKSGRETAGRRLGYSQIANPWYLWRKGTMTRRFALRLALRNMAANHLKTLSPEPWIDRRARAAGNWRALFDILRGRSDPGRILSL